MENENVLLSIAKEGDGDATSVSFHTKSLDDIFEVALGISQVFDDCPKLEQIVAITRIATKTDPKFRELLDNSIVGMPDFNKILKQNG